MALGFHITVYRADRTTSIAHWENMWARHSCDGLKQFERAVERGEGEFLNKSGYPLSFTIRAGAILPLEIHGTCWGVDTKGVPADEMLYIEAWDQS